MFFILSKFLLFIITPLVWIIVAFLWGMLSGRPKRKKRLLWLSFLLLVIFSNRAIVDKAMHLWETPFNESALSEKYDLAIVLGGLSSFSESGQHIEWREGADRLLFPLELYKEGKIKRLLLSGGSGRVFAPEDKEVLHLAKFLLNIGIPKEDIILESNSKNTWENAVFTKAVLDSLALSNGRILLVTSAYHMRRAKACFDKVGLKTTVFPVDFKVEPSIYYLDQYFIPDPMVLATWNLLLKEIVGFFVYLFK